MIGTFFKLVGKTLRFTISRPLQRFNIENRAKKHLGQDAKYFMPAPRAIGAISRDGHSLYPHLEGGGFKSIHRKRLDALKRRQEQLQFGEPIKSDAIKSFSETKRDDNLVIKAVSKLPAIKTVTGIGNPSSQKTSETKETKNSHRPLPRSTNLPLQDPAMIWVVDKTPPGRINLNQLQEIMFNHLADDRYWTPTKLAETYSIKEEYAANLITYFKQIRVVISPRLKNVLDYTAREDPVYQATKDIIYYVDKNLRTKFDRKFDRTFLPTDEIDPYYRELIDFDSIALTEQTIEDKIELFKRPEPLRLSPDNKRNSRESEEKDRKRLPGPKKERSDH